MAQAAAMSAPEPEAERLRIAICTDDSRVLPEARQYLATDFETYFLESWDQLGPLLEQQALHAVLLDIDMLGESSLNGIRALQELRNGQPDLVLVALTRSQARSLRLKAGQAGADEYFVAPVDFQELHDALQQALAERAQEIARRELREELAAKYSFGELVGGSEPMQCVYQAIARVADSPTTVIIRGESGTGKELVARAIVANGPRADRPFISVNCAALPPNLIESELFGHEKGAFTDAREARAGHIEMAHTGTLFLDEIATLDLALQSKLLRVLEDRAVQRLGGKTAKKIDFRLISATNQDLEEMVHTGRFREDLYYRIQVVPILLPPLRERNGDIPLLVDHFLRIYCAANNLPLKRVEPEVLEVLEEDDWPGNVRELENLIQRLVLMVDGPTIKLRHLPQRMIYSSTTTQESLLIPEEGIDFDREMTRIEAAYVQAALRRSGGRKTTAAALLHINAQKMKYLCRKHNIKSV